MTLPTPSHSLPLRLLRRSALLALTGLLLVQAQAQTQAPVQRRGSSVPSQGVPAAQPAAPSQPQAPALPDETTRLLVSGTSDEKRQKELMDWIEQKDVAVRDRLFARTGRQEFETIIAQEENATLTLLNSFGSLSVQVYVDRQSPLFKRDLSGNVSIGDGRMAISALLLDASTRTSARRLSQQAALTLSLAADPSKPSLDTRDYLAQLHDKLQAVLRERQFKIVEPASRGRSVQDLDFMVADMAERPNSLERIGRSVGASAAPPLIVVYDILAQPKPRHELLMFRHDEVPVRVQRMQEAWTAQVTELQQKLANPRFERLATITLPDLIEQKSRRLEADRAAAERRRQETAERLARVKAAATGDGDLAGALRVYRRDRPMPAIKPETAYCSVKTDNEILVQGLARSPAFHTWSGIPKGARFSQLFDTADTLYAAVLDGKCLIVVDVAKHLDRYLVALIREQAHFINVGPVMNRQEAREPYAQSLGYDKADDLELADKLNPVRVTPGQLKALRSFGVPGEPEYAEVRRRMGQQKYGYGAEADASEVLLFLRDEQRGRPLGQTAIQYRQAEDRREAAEALAREEAARRERAERARKYPFVAVLTCGMGSQHINILACFAAEGSYGVATDLKLTSDGKTGVYKAYNLSELGASRNDGFHIDLTEKFALIAQNSHGTLVLGVKIIDRVSGKVLRQDQVGKFGVLSVGN